MYSTKKLFFLISMFFLVASVPLHAADMSTGKQFAIALFLVPVIILGFILVFYVPWNVWMRARTNGVYLGMFKLIAMRLKRINPSTIAESLIQLQKAGIDEVDSNQLEALFLCGGNIDSVVRALICADKANIELSFDKASAIDLAGRNVQEAVLMCVTPRVIETPMIDAMAKDGVQVKVKCKVTVRANIERLIGGAGETTIIARVGEGIVTTIGSSISHNEVLKNPRRITEILKEKNLDSNCAFTIVSIDIADVDIGRNIGSILKRDAAEAQKRIAQAKAEEKKSFAFAREKEMQALEAEMKAKVIESEAQIPLAMAEAYREGRVSAITEQKAEA